MLTSIGGLSNQADIEIIYSKASLSMIYNIALFDREFYVGDSASSNNADGISRRQKSELLNLW